MLKFNPFRPNSLVHPGMFRGRYKELQGLENTIFQTANGNPLHFIIEGERGIGKSSLMLNLDYVARGEIKFIADEDYKSNFLVLNIDLTGSQTMADIVKKVAEEFKIKVMEREALKTQAKAVWEFLTNWEVLGVKYQSDSEVIDPLLVLDNLCQQMAELVKSQSEKRADGTKSLDGILILIDEADQPPASAGLGEFSKSLTERLVRLKCNQVSLGLAGQTTLLQKLIESHESSPRLFTIYSLGTLEDEDVKAVIHAGLEEANRTNKEMTVIEKDAENLLCSLSEGYPHFIQQFAYSAFEVDDDYRISLEDAEMGAYGQKGALDQLGKKFFEQQYFESIGSEDYRKVLQIMSNNSDRWVKRSDLISTSGLQEHTINNAITSLKSKGIIVPNEKQKGSYRLPSKSFAAWIKAHNQAPEEYLKEDSR